MGPGQRDAILHALNDDTQKFVADSGPDRELERAMRECNQHYTSLNTRGNEEGR